MRAEGEMGLVDIAEQGVLRWFWHMENMNEGRLMKNITRSDVRGVKPREISRIGWMDSVKRA